MAESTPSPVPPASTAPPPRRRSLKPRPPLWLQWVLSLSVAALAVVLLIRFVDAHSTPAAQAPHLGPKAARILNQEAEVLDAEQQAPHVVHFTGTLPPTAAIEHAIAAYMTNEINFNRLAGPLRTTLCFAVSLAAGAHVVYRCSALARGTSYPFEGVVDRRTRLIVYCRHNPPPEPRDRVALSRRCTS
jgi:hypothetical protein